MSRGQRMILWLIAHASHPPTNTQLIKWLFLACEHLRQDGDDSPFDFVPYKYGPFSFCAYRALVKLEQSSWIRRSSRLSLAPERQKQGNLPKGKLQKCWRLAATSVLQEFGEMNAHDLLEFVCEKYPWYASRSEHKSGVKHTSHPYAKPAVYTIGYQGVSIDGFVHTLLQSNLKGVIDIRHNAMSRKYGFAEARLQEILSKLDLTYTGHKELGIPSQARRALKERGGYKSLFRDYRRRLLSDYQDQVAQIANDLAENPVVLMCYEHNSTLCHRSVLAQRVAEITGLSIVHL